MAKIVEAKRPSILLSTDKVINGKTQLLPYKYKIKKRDQMGRYISNPRKYATDAKLEANESFLNKCIFVYALHLEIISANFLVTYSLYLII